MQSSSSLQKEETKKLADNEELLIKQIKKVRKIYMLCNPKSGTKYAESFLEEYPKVNNRLLMIPVKKLTDQRVSNEEQIMLDCTLYLFNVIEAPVHGLVPCNARRSV